MKYNKNILVIDIIYRNPRSYVRKPDMLSIYSEVKLQLTLSALLSELERRKAPQGTLYSDRYTTASVAESLASSWTTNLSTRYGCLRTLYFPSDRRETVLHTNNISVKRKQWTSIFNTRKQF